MLNHSEDNVRVERGLPASVYLVNTDGSFPNGAEGPTYVGRAIATPQICAASTAGFYGRDTNIYFSPEWIRELILVDPSMSEEVIAELLAKLGKRAQNSTQTVGCGHVSRNVILTMIHVDDTLDNISEKTFSTLYSSAASETYNKSSPYFAKKFLVCEGDWVNGGPFADTLQDIKTRDFPTSKCPMT